MTKEKENSACDVILLPLHLFISDLLSLYCASEGERGKKQWLLVVPLPPPPRPLQGAEVKYAQPTMIYDAEPHPAATRPWRPRSPSIVATVGRAGGWKPGVISRHICAYELYTKRRCLARPSLLKGLSDIVCVCVCLTYLPSTTNVSTANRRFNVQVKTGSCTFTFTHILMSRAWEIR